MSNFLCILSCSDLPHYSIVDVVGENPIEDNGLDIKQKYSEFGTVNLEFQSKFYGSVSGVVDTLIFDPVTEYHLPSGFYENYFIHRRLTPYKTSLSKNIFKLPVLNVIELLSTEFYMEKIEYYKNNEETKNQINLYLNQKEIKNKQFELYKIQASKTLDKFNNYQKLLTQFDKDTFKLVNNYYLENKSNFGVLGKLSGGYDSKLNYFNNTFLKEQFLNLKFQLPNIKVECVLCKHQIELEYEIENQGLRDELSITFVHLKCKCGEKTSYSQKSLQINFYYLPTKNDIFRVQFERKFKFYLFDLIEGKKI